LSKIKYIPHKMKILEKSRQIFAQLLICR